jgi:branched-chain amino acid transport system ATP-binding protein
MGLHIEGLSAWYGQAHVLDGLTLTVPDGSIVGVVGYNGAGKSTLLRSVARLHTSTSGVVTFDDVNLMKIGASQVARLGISLVREGAQVFDSLTVEEHITLGQRLAKHKPAATAQVENVFETFPMLGKFRKARAGLLSGGQRQTLALATAFASQPAMLLLDEPSTGLAARVADQIYEILALLSSRGITILVVEQNSMWLKRVADSRFLMQDGTLHPEDAS